MDYLRALRKREGILCLKKSWLNSQQWTDCLKNNVIFTKKKKLFRIQHFILSKIVMSINLGCLGVVNFH